LAKIGHPPAFLFYPDDFSSDGKVEAMSTEQVGAYILLLCKSWREKPPGSLPSDDSLLAKWARVPLDRWSEIRSGVLAPYTFGTDSRWHQKRQRAEYDKLMSRRRECSRAGKSSANKRFRTTVERPFNIPIPSPIPSKDKSIKTAQQRRGDHSPEEIRKIEAKQKRLQVEDQFRGESQIGSRVPPSNLGEMSEDQWQEHLSKLKKELRM
jgi:uncharacterized protein YdaU (DUF1376 family)